MPKMLNRAEVNEMAGPKTLEKPVMDQATFVRFEQTLDDLRDAEEKFVFLYDRAIELIEKGFKSLVPESIEAGQAAMSIYRAANRFDVPEPFRPELESRKDNIEAKLYELNKAKSDRDAYEKRRQEVRKMVKGW